MRERWRTISGLWEENKQSHNKLDLMGNLDHYGKLSSQLKWQQRPGDRPIRVVYSTSGEPTAALLPSREVIVDHVLYWIACKDTREAYFLLSIINSDGLYEAVSPMMPTGQFAHATYTSTCGSCPSRSSTPATRCMPRCRRPARRRQRARPASLPGCAKNATASPSPSPAASSASGSAPPRRANQSRTRSAGC